jgi:uncharacterized protein
MVTQAIGRVTIIGRGHAAITASHAKTVELVTEPEIGPRATCVAAVGAQVESGDLLALRGWIDLTIAAGGATDVIRAHANPAFAADHRLVVRRAPAPVRDALLVEADKGASDLDPKLVAALKDPASTVTVSLEPARDARAGRGALIVSPGPPWSIPGQATGGSADLSLHSPLGAEDIELATRSLDQAAYISVEANLAADPAAIALVEAAWSGEHFVLPADRLGPLASALAVAGVDLSSVQVVEARALARGPGSIEPVTTCLVVAVPSGEVARAIRTIGEAIPGARGVVVFDAGTGSMHAARWQAPAGSDVPSRRGHPAIVVAGRVGGGSDGHAAEALPRSVAVLAAELAARGASTRELSAALQRATGMSRKAAYAAALELAPSKRPDS